jgi:hypothetical protein
MMRKKLSCGHLRLISGGICFCRFATLPFFWQYEIWGFQGGENVDCGDLACNTVNSFRQLPPFLRNVDNHPQDYTAPQSRRPQSTMMSVALILTRSVSVTIKISALSQNWRRKHALFIYFIYCDSRLWACKRRMNIIKMRSAQRSALTFGRYRGKCIEFHPFYCMFVKLSLTQREEHRLSVSEKKWLEKNA